MANKIEQGLGSDQPEKSVPVPQYLQKKIDRLEGMEAQRLDTLPDWARKDYAKKIEDLRQEIKINRENLELREQIKTERRENIIGRFGMETLNYAEGIKENVGENIETHLSKAKNKEQAKEILHLWSDFDSAVKILLHQNADKAITDEDALKQAVQAFRPSDAKTPYRHVSEEPEIK